MAGPPAFVQNVVGTASFTAPTVVLTLAASGGFSGTTHVGNMLSLYCRGTAGDNIVSVIDSRGNAWHVDKNSASATSAASMASCVIASGKVLVTGDTITLTLTGTGTAQSAGVAEFSGIAKTSGGAAATDQLANAHNASTGAVTVATPAAGAAGDIALSCAASSVTAATWTIPAPWNRLGFPSAGADLAYTLVLPPGSNPGLWGATVYGAAGQGFSAAQTQFQNTTGRPVTTFKVYNLPVPLTSAAITGNTALQYGLANGWRACLDFHPATDGSDAANLRTSYANLIAAGLTNCVIIFYQEWQSKVTATQIKAVYAAYYADVQTYFPGGCAYDAEGSPGLASYQSGDPSPNCDIYAVDLYTKTTLKGTGWKLEDYIGVAHSRGKPWGRYEMGMDVAGDLSPPTQAQVRADIDNTAALVNTDQAAGLPVDSCMWYYQPQKNLNNDPTPYVTNIQGLADALTQVPAVNAFTAVWTPSSSANSDATIVSYKSQPAFVTTALPGSTQGFAYSQQLAVKWGLGGNAYSVSAGALPDGLTMSAGGLISGTITGSGTFSFTALVTDSGGNTAAKALSITVAPSGGGGGGTDPAGVFPGGPLGIAVEILVNGTWTDISPYVYQRDGIQITGGSTAEGDTPQPAQCTMTLNNRNGQFSPNYAGGAYYPGLQRNIQIRVSAAATSVTGVSYAGYRFWGTVAEWPPASDITGGDVYVQITANGPLRQVAQGGGKGGALTRYYDSLDGTPFAPAAYWPCEEDTAATFICSGVIGGTNMNISGTPIWKANNSFNGTAPMPVVNKSTWDGLTGSFGSSGDDVFTLPGTYNWVASTTTVDARCQGGGGGGTKGQEGGGTGAGGGGGEYARESTLAVTPGNVYQVNVAAGGRAGDYDAGGGDGGPSSVAGDSVTVTANGGNGAAAAGNGGTTAGGSGNTVHFNGGKGGNGGAVNFFGGGGGGGSGGNASAGGAGQNAQAGTGAAGGTAGTGTPPGAAGGTGGWLVAGQSGRVPGGGGGGGWAGGPNHTLGGAGGAGQVELVYTPAPAAKPPANVIRFLVQVPSWGGNNGAVLARAFTAGTLTKLDVAYVTGGKIQLKGYTGGGGSSLAFTSSNLTIGDGNTMIVSVELANSGANVAWALRAIAPGATALKGSVTGTQNTASIDNVTEVLVSPNADVTKTAVGHVSVQYATVPLVQVAEALNGHAGEMGIDRFIRLCAEQALGNDVEFAEGNDHWGFETSTQSWVPANCGLSVSNVTAGSDFPFQSWPSTGATSLLMTASGAGQPTATSPTGTSGQPVNPGDMVSVAADAYAPAGLPAVFAGILWYQSSGAPCAHPEDDGGTNAVPAGGIVTLKKKATAPAGAAFFAVIVGDKNTDANGTLLYIDHVRTSPRMGTQTRDDYREYLKQIKDLEQGMLSESFRMNGLKYRTRIRLISQPVALTLNYAAGQVAPPLAPVQDDKLIVNQVTVKRSEGSRVSVTQSAGQMSTQLPPAGAGKYGKQAKVVADDDAQLIALASHLLNLGTDISARYPVISVSLGNAATAPRLADIANAEVGDRIQVLNLPFWYPDATADQLIIGYTETLNSFEWTITWNCTPATPWTIAASSIRRW